MKEQEQQTQTTGRKEIIDLIHELERKGLDYQKVDDNFSLMVIIGDNDRSGLSLHGAPMDSIKAIVNAMFDDEDFAKIIMASATIFMEIKGRESTTQPDAH